MGNGGLIDILQARHVILPGLNAMFSGAGHRRTRDLFRDIKRLRYPGLAKPQRGTQGADRRQRTLRHLGWLLSDDIFYSYPVPNDRFRQWLRYLTWIEHGPWNAAKVSIDGSQVADPPANAILDTIFDSLDAAGRGNEIEFDWNTAPGPEELVVEVTRNSRPMKIVVYSARLEDIPNLPPSDYDDEFR